VSFTLAAGTDASWAINIFNPVTGTLSQPPIQQYSRFEVGKSAQVGRLPANAVAVTFNGLGRIISPSPIATPNLQQIDVNSVVNGEARTLRICADDVLTMGNSVLLSGSTVVASALISGGIASATLVQADPNANAVTPPILVQVTTTTGQVEIIPVNVQAAVTNKHRVSWGLVSP
jgi:hypothetical protein